MKHWATEIFEYGLCDGKIYHVTKVSNGLKCNCKCPECDEDLVAVNNIRGKKPRPYFRHYNNVECNHKNYQETVVHYLSKQIIESKGYIVVPKLSFSLSKIYRTYWTDIDCDNVPSLKKLPAYFETTSKPYPLYFQEIIIEKKKGQIRPDIQIIVNGKPLIVEVAYTHHVDEVKLTKIKNDHLDAIEIDLSSLNHIASPALIEKTIFSDLSNVLWLNNEKSNGLLKVGMELALSLREYIFENSKEIKTYANLKRVYDCPLKKKTDKIRFVLIDIHCKYCRFYIELRKDFDFSKENYQIEKEYYTEIGEDTTILDDKYGNKILYEPGSLDCSHNIRLELEEQVEAANRELKLHSSSNYQLATLK